MRNLSRFIAVAISVATSPGTVQATTRVGPGDYGLYAIDLCLPSSTLYRVDSLAGTATPQCTTGFFSAGLAYDSRREFFYTGDSEGNILYSVAPGTCATTDWSR